MPGFNTKAVVLKNIDYKDTDKIYTLLSEDNGKISGLAKGVRKISSRRSGNLDSLNVIEVHLHKHISGQNYITEVKTLHSFKNLKNDLRLSKQGFYIAELVNRFLREDDQAHPVFSLLVETLERLDRSKADETLLVNKFELKLMQILGYQPPVKIITKWKELVLSKNLAQADREIKSFINEILQENIKSLELG